MTTDDNRQEQVDEIAERIKSGKPLTDQEVRMYMERTRDMALLSIARDKIAMQVISEDRLRELDMLQKICESMKPKVSGARRFSRPMEYKSKTS